ncbi:MAG: hypothetical protein ACREXS_15670 [Gammaproteobacteria bacterium]
MSVGGHSERLITNTNVQEYFHDSVSRALHNQQLHAELATVDYLVDLLTGFSRAEEFLERTPEGVALQPLASLYAKALETNSLVHRHKFLRRLGDVALFIAGVFSDSLNCKVVDVDYYVAMGSNAYGYLSDCFRGTVREIALSKIFGELSVRFQEFTDVLNEVSERAHLTSDSDIMRLYELWLRTGSKRAAQRLRRLGIQPTAGFASQPRH